MSKSRLILMLLLAAASLTYLPAIAQVVDTDGDGLLDTWETNGYDANGDGTIDVNLPALGASPLRKDIFIEIDWMQGPTCNQKPQVAAIQQVIDAFDLAPISNPDGSTGITLHVDYGQGGLLTGGNILACDPVLVWSSEFQSVKTANFNPARQAIFHYNIWGINYSTGGAATTSSGIAELPGNDFLVSLGSFPGGNGTVIQQAGTFMHEMGHNYGLRHGDSDDVNYKPNHLSVMNYSFQLSGVIRDGLTGIADYSRFAVPSLDENKLRERRGLNGGSALINEGTVWYCNGFTQTTLAANEPIDWNCNGTATILPIATDINLSNGRSVLQAVSNQWENLIYDGGTIGNREVGRLSILESERRFPHVGSYSEEAPAEELLEVARQIAERIK